MMRRKRELKERQERERCSAKGQWKDTLHKVTRSRKETEIMQRALKPGRAADRRGG